MEPIENYQEGFETEAEIMNDKTQEEIEVEQKPADAMAITSMVLGIVSIFFLGIVTGTIGIILAILSRKKGKNGINMTGMICSIVGLALNVLWSVLYVTFLADVLKMLM